MHSISLPKTLNFNKILYIQLTQKSQKHNLNFDENYRGIFCSGIQQKLPVMSKLHLGLVAFSEIHHAVSSKPLFVTKHACFKACTFDSNLRSLTLTHLIRKKMFGGISTVFGCSFFKEGFAENIINIKVKNGVRAPKIIVRGFSDQCFSLIPTLSATLG